MRVQTFRPELAVEGLDEGIVRRLARAGDVERDAALVSPQVEIPGDELGALVDADCRRQTDLTPDPLEQFDDVGAAEAEPRFNRRREARERVDDRQYAQLDTSKTSERRTRLADCRERLGIGRRTNRNQIAWISSFTFNVGGF
jgi:hypothetical protein